MNPKDELQQILNNWSRALTIDGQSGESIVTVHDIDCLIEELEHVMMPQIPPTSFKHRCIRLLKSHIPFPTIVFICLICCECL